MHVECERVKDDSKCFGLNTWINGREGVLEERHTNLEVENGAEDYGQPSEGALPKEECRSEVLTRPLSAGVMRNEEQLPEHSQGESRTQVEGSALDGNRHSL